MAIVLISEPYCKTNGKTQFVMAKCQCGNEFEFHWHRRKTRVSCGCKRIWTKTHGQSRSSGVKNPAYGSWMSMRSRCNNPAHHKFRLYGGRGILICDRWQKFENFISDMGERPDGMTLDRIDSNGNYCPENCRWSDAKQQNRNRSNSRILTIYGKSMCVSEWRDISGVSKELVHARLKSGWTHKESIFGKLKD